jgi:hypothetical protein
MWNNAVQPHTVRTIIHELLVLVRKRYRQTPEIVERIIFPHKQQLHKRNRIIQLDVHGLTCSALVFAVVLLIFVNYQISTRNVQTQMFKKIFCLQSD